MKGGVVVGGQEECVEGSGAGASRVSSGRYSLDRAGQTCQQSRYTGFKKRRGLLRGEEVEGRLVEAPGDGKVRHAQTRNTIA
jgi:hypothetical protein